MASLLKQESLLELPCTPGPDSATPALTPSSELSEQDLDVPPTPIDEDSVWNDTPTKVRKSIYQFKSGESPQSVDQETTLGAKSRSALIDFAFAVTTTKHWLTSHYIPPTGIAQAATEPQTFFSTSQIDLNFSQHDKHQQNLTRAGQTQTTSTPPRHASPTSTSATQARKSQKKSLRQLFERAMPDDILARLTANRTRCAAETVKKPTDRCKHKSPMRKMPETHTLATVQTIREIVQSLDDDGHSSIKDVCEVLDLLRNTIVPRVYCNAGKHVSIATDALDAIIARVQEEHGHARLPEGNCFVVRSWLQGLDSRHTRGVAGASSSLPLSSSISRPEQKSYGVREVLVDPAEPTDTTNSTTFLTPRWSTKPPTTKIVDCERSRPSRVVATSLPVPEARRTSPSRASTQPKSQSITQSATIHNGPTTTIEPFHAPGSRIAKLSVSAHLHNMLSKPLCETDLKDGHLYMFWRRGDFGLIKIGYTTKLTPATRLKEWRRQCRGDLEDCSIVTNPHTRDSADTAKDTAPANNANEAVRGVNANDKKDNDQTDAQSPRIRVRNVRRLEQLVHAELKDYRRKQLNCAGCGKNHKEWFDIDVRFAQQVARKWTNWLAAEERYEHCVGGRLSSSAPAEMEELCTPLEYVQETKKNNAVGSHRSSSSRPETIAGKSASMPPRTSTSPGQGRLRRSARIAEMRRRSDKLAALDENPWSALKCEDFCTASVKVEEASEPQA
jgi:hypothetical protein